MTEEEGRETGGQTPQPRESEMLVVRAGCGHTTLIHREDKQTPLYCLICFSTGEGLLDLGEEMGGGWAGKEEGEK